MRLSPASRTPRLSILLLSSCFGVHAAAQDLSASPADPQGAEQFVSQLVAHDQLDDRYCIPIHTGEAENGIPYGIWAAGPNYKVSFEDGMTFVPMLGRDYPHNQPWSWHTQSAAIGSQQLVQQGPRLSYSDKRAEYDLGGIVEAYDVRPDGVEQTFVIPSAPMSTGDLIIRGVVDSMLTTPAVGAAHQSLSFRDHLGKELVSYGAATAIDANGKQIAMTTSFIDGAVQLELDGNWLANATYPVVVDPLVGPGSQISTGTPDEVDIVRDLDTAVGGVWVSFTLFASAPERDLFLARFDSSGSFLGFAYSDVASWSTEHARLAYGNIADRAVMVFNRRVFSPASSSVRYHSHAANDFAYNSSSSFVADNAWRADVGGAHDSATVLIVYQQEPVAGDFQNTSGSDIYGRRLNLSAGFPILPLGPAFEIASSTFADFERPTMNQWATAENGMRKWCVAYQRYDQFLIGQTDDWDIFVNQVDSVGNVSSPRQINSGSSSHQMAPMIEGDKGRYMVVNTASTTTQLPGKPSGIIGHQIQTTRVDWPYGDANGSEPYGSLTPQSSATARLTVGGLAFDANTRSHWVMSFHNEVSEVIALRVFGYRGYVVRSETAFTPGGINNSARGGITYDTFSDDFVFGYGFDGAANYITTNRFYYPYIVPSSSSGVACSTASIDWVGSQMIGSEFGYINVSGAAADSIHVMVMATSTVAAPLFGLGIVQDGCWLLVPNTGPDFIGLFDLRIGGSAGWTLPMPEFLVNDTFFFQDFHTIGGGDFTLISTQRLALPIGK